MSDKESLVILPRLPFSDSILPQDRDEIAKFMDQPFAALAEIVMGGLASGAKGPMMLGRIAQAAFVGQMYQQVNRTIKELRDKGKLEENFMEKPIGAKTWVDLFKIIDAETPEAERLEAIMAMFVAVNKPNKKDGEEMVNYQHFQTAKRLNSGELFLLKTLYDLYRVQWQASQVYNQGMRVDEWADILSQKMGGYPSTVIIRDEHKLVTEGLLSNYVSSSDALPHQAQTTTANARLTEFGVVFCRLIEQYRKDLT